LVPEPKSEQREAWINLAEVIEDPNQSLEELKASFAKEGKPRSITPTFKLMQLLFIYGIVH
jgi:antibiotic biosynthesis monooxygenase (ABM) superfamily enzyme